MDHNDNSRLSMDTSYPKSKLGRFMIIGGLLGAGVSLFDRGTRKQVGRALNSVKDGGASVLANMRQDPSQVTDQVSNYLQNTATNLRTAVQ
ncbi:MAG TPA: YtxH domain-containing protein, partial [Sporolactobacillaceae bacterium]|nr:YtxH domain-containing protein [Sporolactobacillaceae bacterium]